MQREPVNRAKGGDHDAFTRLVDESIDRLCTVANMILRDPDRAQDAVQEALVSAWRDQPSLRNTEAWDAWTYRLTVRSCYRHARRDRRRTLIELHAMPDATTEHIADVAQPFVERDRLERELGRLPVDQRAVVVVRFYLGWSLPETAANLTVGAQGAVDSSGNEIDGTYVGTLMAPDGTSLGVFPGTFKATRITVEPMPSVAPESPAVSSSPAG
jgi:RNA polymerase sigma-70 factor (ECF subfamily)